MHSTCTAHAHAHAQHVPQVLEAEGAVLRKEMNEAKFTKQRSDRLELVAAQAGLYRFGDRAGREAAALACSAASVAAEAAAATAIDIEVARLRFEDMEARFTIFSTSATSIRAKVAEQLVEAFAGMSTQLARKKCLVGSARWAAMAPGEQATEQALLAAEAAMVAPRHTLAAVLGEVAEAKVCFEKVPPTSPPTLPPSSLPSLTALPRRLALTPPARRRL